MHRVTIRQDIIDRVLARRGCYHLFERLDPKRTALLVIDMQGTFCAPGARGAGRSADLARCRRQHQPADSTLRPLRVPVIWVLHANEQANGRTDWELFFEHHGPNVSGDLADRGESVAAAGLRRRG